MSSEPELDAPPSGSTGPRHPYSKRLLSLAVGDSFHVTLVKRPQVSVLASKWAKSTGRKFITRKVGKLVRIWRVA